MLKSTDASNIKNIWVNNHRFFKSGFLFYLCLTLTTINLNCGETQKLCELNNKNKIDSILLSYPNDIKVVYQIKEGFVDVSNTIIFRYHGADEAKKYITGQDTLIIEWYWNNNHYEEEGVKEWVLRKQSESSYLNCPQLMTKMYLNELSGILSETECEKQNRLLFYGLNNRFNYIVLVYYNALSNNKCAKEEFLAILNSMDFHF